MDKNIDSIVNIPDNTPPSVRQTGQKNINVVNQAGGNVTFINNHEVDHDENGVPFTPVDHVRFDSQKRIIFLGNEQVTIPVELIEPELLTPVELPYINALCEAYADKLGKAVGEVTPDTISSLPKSIRHHYSSQRKAYYQAEYVKHVARETFADGDQQFVTLKNDAYAGIEDTYYEEDYANGYERLKAVLDKITNITLTKSALTNVVGLIGNLEKKGICHILVNDETIKSWVNIDE